MGVIRGCVDVPYGRRGVLGPRKVMLGGDWPYTECRVCGKDMDPKTGEHVKYVPLSDLLEAEEARLVALSQSQHATSKGDENDK